MKIPFVTGLFLLSLIAIVFTFNSCHEAKGFGRTNMEVNPQLGYVDSVYYKALDRQFREKIEEYGCPGMAIAVIQDDQVIFQKEYGVRSVQSPAPIDENTLFRIGSVSKGFAGILAAILIDKGLISLEDPVSYYLPEFDVKAKNEDGILRIKHVLSHTCGYTEHAFSNLVDKNVDREILYKYLAKLSPRDSTGIAYAYQNVAFSLIEQVIEKTTKMSYSEALDDYIFSPLAMCSSSSSFEGIDHNFNHCVGHNGQRNRFVPIALGQHYYNLPSAGGVNASIHDMSFWLSAIMGNRPDVLTPEVLNIAFSAYANTSSERKFWNKRREVLSSHYGLGWRLVKTLNNDLVYHGGLVNGFRSEIAFDKNTKTGVVVLFNSLCGYSNSVIFDFFEFSNTYLQDNGEEYL
ncbi:MAG: beta-lactamase family protein [Chitinophagales bacterium]|nr:beta-lactamase family protein [Chitinophagales bacterium]